MTTTQVGNLTTFAQGLISSEGLNVLKKKIEKLNKRARRLGRSEIQLNITRQVEISQEHPSGVCIPLLRHEVEVMGVVPKAEGWQVIAKLTPVAVGQNLTALAPGVKEINPCYRTTLNHCDHCRTKRRRNDLIVIRHETGAEMIVGRRCLADFIRTGDVEAMLNYAKMFDEVSNWIEEAEDEFHHGCGNGRMSMDDTLDAVLLATAVVVRRLGWTSVTTAQQHEGMTSTRSNVAYFLHGGGYSRASIEEHRQWIATNKLHVTEEDQQTVELTKKWLDNIPPNAASEYLYNLLLINRLPYVPRDKFGWVVSAVPSALRDNEHKLKYQKTQVGPREWIGVVGIRMKGITVKVLKTKPYEGAYGPGTIVRFQCSDGILVWFASGEKEDEYKEGDEYIIDATIREHVDHEKFGKSTTITRVRCQRQLTQTQEEQHG